MKIKPWKLLSSKTVFSHKWYNLRQDTVELQDGTVLDDYFVSVRPDVVLVYAETEDGSVLLVRQYKHAGGDIFIELPGGFFHKESEEALDAAKRELKEETGFVSDDWKNIAVFTDNPTKDTTRIHVYYAANCRKESGQNLDPAENIEVLEHKPEQLLEMVQKGDIQVSASVATIMMMRQEGSTSSS